MASDFPKSQVLYGQKGSQGLQLIKPQDPNQITTCAFFDTYVQSLCIEIQILHPDLQVGQKVLQFEV